ncbi:MAG TPA: MFS transporter, partial [Thermoanaerobaculia bacterium]
FVMFLIATVCVMWVEFQIHSTLPLHLTSLGFSPATYGMLLSINGIMIVLFELALTNVTTRYRPQPIIALGYGLAAIGFCLTGFAFTLPALAATVVVWTIGEMIYAPVTGVYVTNLAPERYRGRYNGMWMQMWSVAMILGPAMGTWIYSRNPNALWIACAVMGAAGATLPLLSLSEARKQQHSRG